LYVLVGWGFGWGGEEPEAERGKISTGKTEKEAGGKP